MSFRITRSAESARGRLSWRLCRYAPAILTLPLCAGLAGAAVKIERSHSGWLIQNERVRLELRRTASGKIALGALEDLATGYDWAAPGTPAWVRLEGAEPELAFQFDSDEVKDLPNGGVQLGICSTDQRTQARLWLLIRAYPSTSAIEYTARLENHGTASLPLVFRMDPIALYLKRTAPQLRLYTADRQGTHGFGNTGALAARNEFKNWLVLQDPARDESLLVGGDFAAGVFQWEVDVDQAPEGTLVHAGPTFRPYQKSQLRPAYEVAPGQTAETPIEFIALAHGDADDVANATFRYLKRYVLPAPVPNSPLAAYCIWFTVPNSQELLLDELKFAKRIGFEVFYHDASWYEGSSLVPGMNDWISGLGSYRDSREKFPNGIKELSDAIRKAGLKFGLWVDPGNVDARRVASGEIPESWVARIDGKALEGRHPSLAPNTQLCLGNPAVVAWIKKELTRIIEDWNVEWLKWDPSATVSYDCNRTDHGHGAHDGAYAAYRGMMDIWSYLTRRFPSLIGFECEPSLLYSRTNPGPPALIPGGYTYEFITGPMVSPSVWGSLYSSTHELTGDWYSASALDYALRKHFTHGVVFGNINGMVAQRLSAAPAGYIEAFQRNLLYFKQYRHLLTEDVYHPRPAFPEEWTALEYARQDASEAVLFVFRDGGTRADNEIRLRGLDPAARYLVTSLNQRPGRERVIPGKELIAGGLKVTLPDDWLVKGDRLPDKKYEDQLRYGSDVILLRRNP